jgi:hypothetical protein
MLVHSRFFHLDTLNQQFVGESCAKNFIISNNLRHASGKDCCRYNYQWVGMMLAVCETLSKGSGKITLKETAMEVIIFVPLPHIFQIHLVESIKHVVVTW